MDRPIQKGRGAQRNIKGRFERREVVPFDDGWGSLDEQARRIETTTIQDATRTIIATNDSPDIPFNRSINPYRGCEHGCSYCFARPSHAYLDLSPGLDFESKIVVKPEAPAILRRTLTRPGYRCEPIALGSNTDPYQPLERSLKITRGILEVLAEFKHPVTIVTKSNMILRDVDLLASMARANRVAVFLSVTTLDRTLARRMEPRAATPERRLQAVAELNDAGIPSGVLASPIIPALNDHELESILEAAVTAGAHTAWYQLVRLAHELKQLFEEWLRIHYPTRADKVLGQLREMRAGGLTSPRFGERMTGGGPYAELLRRRFQVACRRLGLDQETPELDTASFRVPGGQGRLFG